MKGLQDPSSHVTEFCGEMQGKFKVGLTRLTSAPAVPHTRSGKEMNIN